MQLSLTIVILMLLFLELFFTSIIIAMVAKTKPRDPDVREENCTNVNMDDALASNCQKYALTSREIEILKLLRGGLPYKLIADQLNISTRTVTTHVANMFSKVNMKNKMELVSRICGE